jgi:copper homeostasis protein
MSSVEHAPSRALLDVAVVHARDVAGADAGGADRLWLIQREGDQWLSPEPATASSACTETDLTVRVMLRLNDGHTTNGGELARLVGLGEDYLSVGAAGLAFGFLDMNTEVDVEVCGYLVDRLPEVPWTFHGGFDDALDTDLAWRRVRELPGLDAVLSAGDPRGLAAGADRLIATAASDPTVARLLMAGNGLRPEQVPWLTRAGVRQFHVGASARMDRSWTKAYVDAGLVRAWRLLLDDALDRALGNPTA